MKPNNIADVNSVPVPCRGISVCTQTQHLTCSNATPPCSTIVPQVQLHPAEQNAGQSSTADHTRAGSESHHDISISAAVTHNSDTTPQQYGNIWATVPSNCSQLHGSSTANRMSVREYLTYQPLTHNCPTTIEYDALPWAVILAVLLS